MARDTNSSDDFHSRALSSLYNQTLLHSNDDGTKEARKISCRKNATNAQRQEEEGVESFAQYLVEDDTPKIDSAVKAYLSLVAARSAVQSEIDVISTSPLSSLLVSVSSSSSREVAAGAADGGLGTIMTNDEERSRQCCCTFAGNVDANQCALVCARTLLSTINSTILPSLESDVSSEVDNIDDNDNTSKVDTNADNEAKRKMKQQQKLQSDTTRIIWNKLARKASSSSSSSSSSPSGDKLANTTNVSITMKPSKVLGRQSLLVAYPYIQERLRRGITLTDAENVQQNSTKTIPSSLTNTNTTFNLPLQSLSDEILPPVLPPKGMDIDKWKAFYTEFGHLLLIASSLSTSSSAVVMVEEGQPNDSALIWSKDGGAAELQSRRESRTRRAAEALVTLDTVALVEEE